MNRDSSPFFSTGLVSKILAKGDAAFFVSFLATGAALTGAKIHHTMDNINTRIHMIRRSKLDTENCLPFFSTGLAFSAGGNKFAKGDFAEGWIDEVIKREMRNDNYYNDT